MKGSARGNWDPREGQQPFRPNPNEVGDRTTTLRRLLIGAAQAAIAHLNSLPPHNLVIWTNGLMALFLFLLAKAARSSLSTALPVALRLLFSFRQALYVQVFRRGLRHFASSPLVSAAPTSQSFLFSFSLTLALSSPPSFLLSLTLW